MELGIFPALYLLRDSFVKLRVIAGEDIDVDICVLAILDARR